MKRIISVLLSIILAFSLVACNQPSSQIEEPKNVDVIEEINEEKIEETDVVVVGAGGTGLTAAYFAKEAGLNVILLEKRSFTGGNTAMAGFMAAGGTRMHKEYGVEFTADDHYNFLMETEGVEPEFARLLADNAGSAAEWLVDTLGIEITSIVNREIYAVKEKTKFPAQIVTNLTELNIEKGVDIRLDSPATKLIVEDGEVKGVQVDGPEGTYMVKAKSVILASGGFAASQDLLKEYAPEWVGGTTSNTSATTGDGIIMAKEIGAAISNMDQFTFNPTFYDHNGATLSVSGVRYEGGILVGFDGKRFADEMAGYSEIAYAELALPESSGYAIMDSNSLGTNPTYCVTADTIEELAALIDIDADSLVDTVTKYRSYYDSGIDEEFGRTDMRSRIDTAPYYAIKVFPGVHHTRGGVTVNTRCQVLDTNGNAIKNLYAAGEVADAKLQGNDSVSVAITFGRMSAKSVIEDLSK